MYIRANKPSLNKDGGRYKLPRVFDRFWSQVFERPLTPNLGCQSPDEGRRIDQKFEVCGKFVLRSKVQNPDLTYLPTQMNFYSNSDKCWSKLPPKCHIFTIGNVHRRYCITSAIISWATNPIIQSLSLRIELGSLELTFQNWEPFPFFSCSRFCLIVNWIPTWSCGINVRPTYWRYKSPSYENPQYPASI